MRQSYNLAVNFNVFCALMEDKVDKNWIALALSACNGVVWLCRKSNFARGDHVAK